MASSRCRASSRRSTDAAHFTPYHWVDALLAGKSKRVLHILQQLRLEGSEPAILLRTLQRELLLLVNLNASRPIRRCVRCSINIGYGRTVDSC
ncbi:DNA polymerase III subunit delta [Raoultella ornithinolytica]|nr:DNA polymerase III subunit delta [Raoultella ornithinolytica]